MSAPATEHDSLINRVVTAVSYDGRTGAIRSITFSGVGTIEFELPRDDRFSAGYRVGWNGGWQEAVRKLTKACSEAVYERPEPE